MIPSPLWRPLSLLQPYLEPAKVCFGQEGAGGTRRLHEMEVNKQESHHYWKSNAFQKGCPCRKQITEVVRRSKESNKTKPGWLWHYCLTDHRLKPPIVVFPFTVIILTNGAMAAVKCRDKAIASPLSSKVSMLFSSFLRIPPLNPCFSWVFVPQQSQS